jgi:hypothetical protein
MEPSNAIYYATTVVGLLFLITLYFFGVWSRTYVMPAANHPPVGRQLVAAVPVGLVTMGLYAKSAFPALMVGPETVAFDVAVMAGYAIIFGMLSRESLDRLLHSVQRGGGP